MPEFFNGSYQGNSNNAEKKPVSKTRFLGFITLLLLIFVVPITVWVSKSTQETRQHAAGITPAATGTDTPTPSCVTPAPITNVQIICTNCTGQ